MSSVLTSIFYSPIPRATVLDHAHKEVRVAKHVQDAYEAYLRSGEIPDAFGDSSGYYDYNDYFDDNEFGWGWDFDSRGCIHGQWVETNGCYSCDLDEYESERFGGLEPASGWFVPDPFRKQRVAHAAAKRREAARRDETIRAHARKVRAYKDPDQKAWHAHAGKGRPGAFVDRQRDAKTQAKRLRDELTFHV
jgi:hypothetical protein